MTGWRMGWIVGRPALGQAIENLIQYSTSGVAQFMQRAAVTALDRGGGFVSHLIGPARHGRDIVCRGLPSTPRCRLAEPPGAFHLFFQGHDHTDTPRLPMRPLDDA